MLYIEFEYKDKLSHGKWNKQSCFCTSVEECIEWYGLGKDCEYHILKVSNKEEK